MNTRDRLLDATVRCLATDGWARTTTRRIVAEAGAHLPDVRYHFGNKEGLMHAAALHAACRWAAGPLAEMHESEIAGPRAALTDALARFLGALREDRSDGVAAIETFAQLERSEALRGDLAEAYRGFRAQVSTAIAADAGIDASPTTDHLATVLMALFDGLAIQWLIEPDELPSAEALVDALGQLALIAGSESPPSEN